MARKKKAPDEGPGQEWLATFADLMNLLVCFFVLLFAASSIEEEKLEAIAMSVSNSFHIFSAGGNVLLDESTLLSNGLSQLDNMIEYVNSETDGEDVENDEVEMTDAMEEILEQNKEASQAMYEEMSDLAEKQNVSDYIELSIDPNYQYVKISLSGSVLFDPGKATIKEETLPIISKVGDILKGYDNYLIQIEGHTDNVPINSSVFPNNNWLSSARALNAATYLMEVKGLDPKTLSWTGRGEYEPIASNATAEGRSKNRRIEFKIYNDIAN